MEAPSITNRNERFIVRATNVRQASRLIRQCYIALVSWLDVALRERRQSIVENAGITHWKSAYDNLEKEDDGTILKSLVINEFMQIARQSRPTAFRKYKKVNGVNNDTYFIESKIGKSVYVRWRSDEE
jgi:hypothetical protein